MPKAPPKEDTDSDSSEDEEVTAAQDANRRTRMQQEFDTLHNEMEIAQYGTTETGQLRRKLPRHQSRARTQKRRLLERQDDHEQAVEVAEGNRKRLRGSRAAQEDHVIQGSLVFGSQSQSQALDSNLDKKAKNSEGSEDEEVIEDDENDEDDDDDDDDAVEADEEYEDEGVIEDDDQEVVEEDYDPADYDPAEAAEEDDDQEEIVEEDYDRAEAYEEDDDQEEVIEEDDDQEEDDEEEEIAAPKKAIPTSASKKAKKTPAKKSGKKRRLFRLKNFTSQRMAQRHGDALGAHARGMPKVAIQKLKQIAREVPSASQVYSSLGMVYEDMLRESRKKNLLLPVPLSENQDSEQVKNPLEAEAGDTLADEDVPDKLLAEQLDLARKAYGAYHVAAILCKKDYTLWVRAADSAAEIADLHSSVNDISGIQENVATFHKREKERWLSEAKSDYKVADHLKPPGIDVPAKLAAALIQLGSLSEALTLLTDLKNTGSTGQEHSEFEASYKAWLLYSDLMLRIGHECTKWNNGNQTNENYMFRRWLRKLSKTFDWKERRLQALSMALKAAAGSSAAISYIEWLQNRAVSMARDDAEKAVAGGDSEPIDIATPADQSATDTLPIAEQFEQEKSLLIKRNQSELAAFDKTTKDMALVAGSIPSKEREKARDAFVKSHKATVVALVGEYYQSQTSSTLTSESAIEPAVEQLTAGDLKTSLSPSSSCTTVYKIASELMRHLLKAQLYDGARLVGEAVSSYLKERAALLDKRIEARENYKQVQNRPTSIFAFQREEYDAVDDRSDGDASDAPLSDEDELEESFGAPIVQQSLRRGALPPELRVLYGLSLVGVGGRNFLAAKCLESIEALEEVPLTSSTKDTVDVNQNTGSSWIDCHLAASEPLGRLAAYAFTVDVLRATNKENSMAAFLAPMFAGYYELLKGEEAVELSLKMKMGNSIALYETTYQHVSRVVLASFRYQFYQAESLISHDDRVKRTKGKELAVAIIESLFHFFPILWMVESDASVGSECIELLSLFARAFALLTKDATQEAGYNEKDLSNLLQRLQKLVSLLCGGIEFDLLGTSASSDLQESTADLTCVPFANSWLSSEQERLLLRTNNLCIATNVSLFSGWEGKRFSLQLLRHRDVDNFFGLTMQDGHVAGYLGPILEEELSDQWDMLNSHLPEASSFNFRAHLGALKATPWYTENEDKHKARQNNAIPSFGEDVGLSILSTFSRICIHLAAGIDEQHQKDRLLFTSMSILLPMSQFSLNQKLVESKVSKEDEAEANSTSRALANVPAKQLEERLGALHDSRGDGALLYKSGTSRVPKSKSSYVRPPRRVAPSQKPEDVSLHDWFNGENSDSHLINLVAIPCSVLQDAWGKSIEGSTTRTPESATAATEAMLKLHKCMQELRACCSEQAVEKACLEVAGALIQLAPICHNHFLCLQQAAMFAGNSFKGGNSNLYFREPLPSKELCTPLEALIILGRADCLQAVLFCPEAAFLCSFVASVCSHHRNHDHENFEANEQWKIVAIMAYNVSVMIRHTALMLLQEQDKRDDSSWPWECDVIEELKRGRVDGRSWKKSLGASSTGDDGNFANTDDDDEGVEHHNAGVGGGAMLVDADEVYRDAEARGETDVLFHNGVPASSMVHQDEVGATVATGDAYRDAGTTGEADSIFHNVIPASSLVHQDDDSSVEMFAV
jgi:hypothetical protein